MQGLLRTGPDDLADPGAEQGGAQRCAGRRHVLLPAEDPAAAGRGAEPRPRHPAAVLPGAGAQSRSCAGSCGFARRADLNLGFIDGRRGQKPILIFPDSRRAEKRWNGFRQLTDLLLRDGSGRKVIWAGNNLRLLPREFSRRAVPQSHGQHEPRFAGGAGPARGLGHLQRQRAAASGGGARREDAGYFRADGSAVVWALSAQQPDQSRRAGARWATCACSPPGTSMRGLRGSTR